MIAQNVVLVSATNTNCKYCGNPVVQGSKYCYVCKTKIGKCKHSIQKEFKRAAGVTSVPWCDLLDCRLTKRRKPGEVLNGSICNNCPEKEVIINEEGNNN